MNYEKILAILLSVIIAGCSSTRSASFKEMSSSYREVVEQYSNDNILLNVVRASDNMPLSFLDIPSVVGSGSITTNASLSSNIVSAAPSSVSGFFSAANAASDASMSLVSAGMALNNSFTFTQSSLDNSAFMMAFLKGIPLEFIDLKGTERLRPKTVEYTLLIESIELHGKNDVETLKYINDPMDPSHSDFQQALLLLVEAGLKVEKRAHKTPISMEMSESAFNAYSKSWGDSIINNIADGKFIVDKKTSKGINTYQLVKLDTQAHMCINKHLAQALFKDLFSEGSYCINSPKNEHVADNFSEVLTLQKRDRKNFKNMDLVIKIRSAGNIFDFLGSVLLVQKQNPDKLVMINPSKHLLQSYYPNYREPSPLFKVYKNNSDKSIKMSTTVVYKGDTYSIADEDDSYSKLVMEYLSTLLTVSKVPGSIPPSPAVIVR